ncbi:MAG TPA: hypothetical protein VN436_00760, partial [Holophaga sp.]|nr:hypothetical protein [Holophaga sp.]
AQRTMLTEATTEAILVMEQVDGSRSHELEAALAELGELVRRHLGGQAELHMARGAGRSELVP